MSADTKRKIYKLIGERGDKGATHKFIEESLGLQKDDMVKAINFFLKKNHIQLLETTGGEPVYKMKAAVTTEATLEIKQLTPEQQVLYRIIESAQRDGIWTKTLKQRANMNRVFAKVLRVLETKKLVRSFKSVTSKFKKFYILNELEQADYHKGGIWYNSALEFDEEFVQVLTEKTYGFIRSKNYATLENVRDYIESSGVAKVEISAEDSKKLIQALIYDGLVESFKNPSLNGELSYKATRVTMPKNGLTATPCGICSITHLCGKTSEVTPQNCVYLTQWLDF